MTLRATILIFEEVELLDFAGPHEVLSSARSGDGRRLIEVTTVAFAPGPVTTRNGLKVIPDALTTDPSPIDLLVVPGGIGARAVLASAPQRAQVAALHRRAKLTLSVCTGALILARVGLLDGLRATTHHSALDELRALAPTCQLHPEARVVDNGPIITAAGVAAGIDGALHAVSRLIDVPTATRTAAHIEYPWSPLPA